MWNRQIEPLGCAIHVLRGKMSQEEFCQRARLADANRLTKIELGHIHPLKEELEGIALATGIIGIENRHGVARPSSGLTTEELGSLLMRTAFDDRDGCLQIDSCPGGNACPYFQRR